MTCHDDDRLANVSFLRSGLLVFGVESKPSFEISNYRLVPFA